MPPGDVRGFDVRTGRERWVFHTVPEAEELGSETWEDGSLRYSGNTNVWAPMSCDPELGIVYLPVSTPTNDYYGGHRPGANLFGDSLVALDAETGERVWHYQLVHHGLWDYDLPAAPNLVDVRVGGRRVRAVAQVTKQGFCFVFDRETGKPLWPIDERPVPPTTVPGDRAWPTQPFPTRPAPFERQGASEDDLIDWTPELRREALAILRRWVHGPLFTPPGRRPTILLPGRFGGASWAGAAHDPETGILYVSSVTEPTWLALGKPPSPDATVRYMITDSGDRVAGPRGLPLFRGPYGRITAIDLNTGDHRWVTPLGEGPRDHPAIRHLDLPRLGHARRGYLVVTQTLLLAIQEGSWFNQDRPTEPPVLRAFEKETGVLLGEIPVPGHATGAPITYLVDGKQYFVYPTGGAGEPALLVALAITDGGGNPDRARGPNSARDQGAKSQP
jgi:quinoprotein glucose dehydrogenase